MRSSLRKLIWFALIVAACGIAIAFVVYGRSSVTLAVISMEGRSDSRVARCEIQNRGDKPIELTVHSIDDKPFFHRLQRLRGSWEQVGWHMECGIDAEKRSLAPGQTLSFTASIIDTSQPIRIELGFRIDGGEYTVSSKTIIP